jgi:membrane associated rhomboid family serine protease
VIIVLKVAVYLTTGAFKPDSGAARGRIIGAGSGRIAGLIPPAIGYDPVPEPFTLVTYQFLHGSWWHLISNMLFLWVFADNIEDAFGHVAFAMFYLVCGIVGALAHVMLVPLSGSTAGGRIGCGIRHAGRLCGALSQGPRLDPALHAPAACGSGPSGCWAAGSCCRSSPGGWTAPIPKTEIAWGAHIGGFIAGAAITYAIRRRL